MLSHRRDLDCDARNEAEACGDRRFAQSPPPSLPPLPPPPSGPRPLRGARNSGSSAGWLERSIKSRAAPEVGPGPRAVGLRPPVGSSRGGGPTPLMGAVGADISPSDLEMMEQIGKGATGDVFRGARARWRAGSREAGAAVAPG
jgi:hypothetical protein